MNEQVDVRQLLENLIKKTDQRRDEYARTLNTLRDKFIQDSETIKMGLLKLVGTDEHNSGLSMQSIQALHSLAQSDFPSSDWDSVDIENMRECERQLALLEKEIIGILSNRFKR